MATKIPTSDDEGERLRPPSCSNSDANPNSKSKSKGHPSLRGGQRPLPHEFGPRQMRALSAICETFVPSIRLASERASESSSHLQKNVTYKDDSDANHDGVTPGQSLSRQEALAKSGADDVGTFYRISASDVHLSDQVAGHIFRTLKPSVILVVKCVLWMLATSWGTLLLFGPRVSLSWRYPFVHSFVTLSYERRERALLKWASSGITLFAKLFKLLKQYSVFLFYAKVDEDGRSPCWNAIGYCGADPSVSAFSSETGTTQQRPLDGKVLDPDSPGSGSGNNKQKLASFLDQGGFTLLENISHLENFCSSTFKAENKNAGGKVGNGEGQVKAEKTTLGVRCDVVVVGSGSGGGVVAGTLAKAGLKVLILEQGRYFARDDLTLLEGPSMMAMYDGAGSLATDDGNVSLLAGTTVGGGSAINWAASLRTPEHVRREWTERNGLPLFASDEYTRALDEVCVRGSVEDDEDSLIARNPSFQNRILAEGCRKLGFDISEIPRNVKGGEHSCGWCNFGCRTGEKQGTAETWLVDAVDAGGLILSSCKVRQVLHRESSDNGGKKRKAVGVVAAWGGAGGKGDEVTLYVEAKVTVVCCGSLSTPPLLLESGLTNPNIGRHLHLHPVIMAWGYFPQGRGPPGNSYEGAIMTAMSRESANWDSSGYGGILEVPIMHPATFAALTPWLSGLDHKERMRKYASTAHIINLLRDEGSGRVGLDSRDGGRKITYPLGEKDQARLLEGVENGLRALVAAGAEEVGTQHGDGKTFSFKGREDDESRSSSVMMEEFEKFLKDVRIAGMGGLKTPVCSAHQMSSCRMGRSSEMSAVDSTGETWEVEDLFLGDASVFPTASGVNPMITTQAIALCTAKNIIRKIQNSKGGVREMDDGHSITPFPLRNRHTKQPPQENGS